MKKYVLVATLSAGFFLASNSLYAVTFPGPPTECDEGFTQAEKEKSANLGANTFDEGKIRGNGKISGKVLLNGSPVANAVVWLYFDWQEPTVSQPIAVSTSSKDGEYSFDSVAEGFYIAYAFEDIDKDGSFDWGETHGMNYVEVDANFPQGSQAPVGNVSLSPFSTVVKEALHQR